MWTTFAFVATLGLPPGASGAMTLTNVRLTHGILGVPREGTKFLPGDICVFAFDVQGITADESGKVLYSVAMEVTDANGKVTFRQAPQNLEANNSLGGDRLPAYANLTIGLDEPPGKYKVKVTVTDRAARTSATLTRSYEVLPGAFGLVRLTTTADPDGRVPLPFPAEGQSLWIGFGAVGFGRDGDTGHPHLEVTLRVFDESGKPTLAKPFTGRVTKDVPKKARAVPMQFMLELNRPGKFTVKVEALDKVKNAKATLAFAVTVQKAR
jgi:hypothetical protein